MFSWLTGSSKPAATATGTAAPSVNATKCFTEDLPSHEIIYECVTNLKRSKAGVARLNAFFSRVDAIKSEEDAERIKGEIIGFADLLTRAEKRLLERYLSALKTDLRTGRGLAARSDRKALRAETAAGSALAERNVAARSAAAAVTAANAAIAGVGAGNMANRMTRVATAAARNAGLATRRANRAEAAVARTFTRNAARAAAARTATNAAVGAPARPPVPGGRFSATGAATGAPGNYAGGCRKTRCRAQRKSRRAQRKSRH